MDTYNQNMSELLHTEHISPPVSGTSHINVGTTERVASLIGGALLAYYGLKRTDKAGWFLAATGGSLLFRGITGYCPTNEALGRNTAGEKDIAIEITRSLTINRPRAELYQFWRMFENLPRFMHHLKEVRQLGPKRSHWVARIPKGVGTVEWEADIIEEETDRLIAWRSLEGSDVDNAGEVRFLDAPANRGTIVQATITYRPPIGDVGGGIAKLLNPVFKQMVLNDLHRFKQLMESGEVATIKGQPSGRK
ncbi:YgaP-like transmembrane domain [Pontibacter korlensis]|uniref:YgaP-like transmembrane domain n=1 Tax=Pontibacter korlensis TaxID=400092 RepID=UPI00061AE788|nr:YgaP-like transmembrane domain [Pontibacter korlensis]